ncbi:thioesterase family protein [Polaribacter vadi]|uniref:thioesterase family protein n=1 Tax=Polaribacter TaxID=52959 RepID=UPI001C085CD0|nr:MULTISPECIES: thioesterase family protein [Polaribacter]MBU3012107.1 thioesterase family protein [Polaribacter vadi]MDO6741923.1 thioesterase family protein [Polaribacter sp. 1_MG-2023]
MFQRNYKVNGKDVNDFMVMQNAAYLSYSSKLLETFLFVKGFTRLKMNALKVGLQKKNDKIIQYKPLLFTQSFSVDLEFKSIAFSNQKMNVCIHFYNDKKELCTTITRELFWFDYTSWQTISPPKTIIKYFVEDKEFREVE